MIIPTAAEDEDDITLEKKDHAPRIERREDPSQDDEGVVHPIHPHLCLRHHRRRLAHVRVPEDGRAGKISSTKDPRVKGDIIGAKRNQMTRTVHHPRLPYRLVMEEEEDKRKGGKSDDIIDMIVKVMNLIVPKRIQSMAKMNQSKHPSNIMITRMLMILIRLHLPPQTKTIQKIHPP